MLYQTYFYVVIFNKCIIIFGENSELVQRISLYSLADFGVAGVAARVGTFKHFDLLQIAEIPPVEFQDATKPGLEHNSANKCIDLLLGM